MLELAVVVGGGMTVKVLLDRAKQAYWNSYRLTI